MAGFTDRERRDAARTEVACRERLARIEAAHQVAGTKAEHDALSREAHNLYRELQRATFILTDEGGA